MGTYSESYWKRREEADRKREGAPPEPELDVAESAPESSPAFDVAGSTQTDDETVTAPPVPAPIAAPDDGMRSERLKAIQRVRELAEAPYEPPEGLRDTDIAAASERDRDQVRRDNFTSGLAAAISRRPTHMRALPSESQSLTQRRATADAAAARRQGLGLSANARIAAALKGGKTDGLTLYQQEQLKRADADDAYRSKHDVESAKRSQENIEATRDATAAQREFNNTMAKMGFGQRIDEQKYKRDRDVDEDTKDLGKAIGGEPEHLQGLIGRLKGATSKGDIPGVGPIDKLTPDLLASDEALQTRNDMREAVRIMLSMKSGKTVTPQEAEDYAKIYGISGSEQAFRQGVHRLEADIADTIKAKKAGFSPAAVERFEGRGGAPTPKKPGAPVAEQPPDGAIPPNAKNVRKHGKGWAYTLPDGTDEYVGPP